MSLCLVTGASGFVGSHLAEELVRRRYKVHCLVRKSSNLNWLIDKGVEFVFGDIQDKETLKKILVDYEYIFHTAGLIKSHNPALFFKVNYEGTRNLLEAAWENQLPLKRFVYISSLAAAGPSLNNRPKKESDLCNPTSVYGQSKLAGERETFRYSEKFPVTVIRPPGIYGPRDKQLLSIFKVIQWGIMPVLGKGDNQFSLIHVKDLVNGIISATESNRARGQPYFLSDGQAYTWLEAGKTLAEVQEKKFRNLTIPKWVLYLLATGADMLATVSRKSFYLTRRKIKELDYQLWVCDISKAKQELGFQPKYDFKTGARETIQWYKEQKWI